LRDFRFMAAPLQDTEQRNDDRRGGSRCPEAAQAA
jgi:hypothetical protein